MSRFDNIINHTALAEGGYQALKSDSANYNSLKQLVGTNLGISAKAYEAYLKRPPTVKDMMAITPAIRNQVYKTLFYVPLQADLLKSDSVAHLAFDTFIATGNVLLIKKAIGQLIGKSTSGLYNLSANDIKAINAINAKLFFDRLKLLNYQQRRVAAAQYGANKKKVLEAWNKRLDKIAFVN